MKVLKDYSFVRGVCHGPRENNPEIWKRDFGYMNRLKLNSVRMWMSQKKWEEEGDAYIDMIASYIRTGWEMGISTMPILWNGNYISEFTPLTDEEWEAAEKYGKAAIEGLRNEPGLIMWDAINEPMCNDYLRKSPPEEYTQRFENITYYTRRLCDIVRKYDTENALTVGHEIYEHVHTTIDLVDVVSYHDYRHTRKEMEDVILKVKKLADENGGKPILNTETGCICRSNPYDIELELCEKYNVGWYIFNLIISGPWGDVHGLVYPDGTIRDPNVIAAVLGFYRKRTPDRIRANPNREGHVSEAIEQMEQALGVKQTTLHRFAMSSSDELLEAAEYVVNQLEAAEMVPMWNPPSARIECWRAMPEEQRDIYEIREFCYEMMNLLKKACLL